MSQPLTRQAHAIQKIDTQVHMVMLGSAQPGANAATLCMALNAPSHLDSMMRKECAFNIIWDSGATISISNLWDNFVGPIKAPKMWKTLTGRLLKEKVM